jgi:acetolactate synthase-1/2/3 large subunit
MTQMSGAEALTQSFIRHGVDTIFCLPGAQLDYLFDAFHKEPDRLRIIHTRHEQGAGYMAMGYAHSTGKVGVCAVVPGPGVFNVGAALCSAHGLNVPVFCLGGQILSQWMGKGSGQLHEIADQPGVVASVTKWRGSAETPGAAPALINEAFAQLNTGRRQPVYFEMAPDIMRDPGEVTLLDPVADYGALEAEPDDDAIEQAAAMIGNAENPAIFVGGGIFGAEAELLALAEEVQAPVFMSPQGQGALDYRHYLAQNWTLGRDMWPEFDVIVAAGSRMLAPLAGWKLPEGAKYIRIDIDPKQSLNLATPDVHLVAPAKTALGRLAMRAQRHNRKRDSREDELNARKKAKEDEYFGLEPLASFAQTLRRELDDDGIACWGVTQMGFYAQYGYPVYGPRTSFHAGYQGTLGYAFPTALGAKVAHPDKQVMAVVGDGGFMFCANELATAVHHKINLVTVVFNDSHFGNVHRNQRLFFDGRHIADQLSNPDFVKFAESFGAIGLRAETPDELGTALKTAFKAAAPVLIEVPVGELPSPWKYVPIGRSMYKIVEE